MSRQALQLTIRGRVQGVGYRAWVMDQARRLGLDGWARNRRDGSVEVLAIGAPDAIETLAAACRQGPAAARVASVQTAPGSDDGWHGFALRPTL